MKFLAVICAGLVASAAITPITVETASAQPRWGHGGHGGKWKTVCRWEGRGRWKHKVCRKVRVGWR